MRLRSVAFISAAAFAASAAPARDSSPAPEARECFQLAAVTGYSQARGNQVHVHTGPGETYLFKTLGSCPDLGWSESIALDPVTASPICRGIDVDLIVPSPTGPRRCPVAMIRKLAPGDKEGH